MQGLDHPGRDRLSEHRPRSGAEDRSGPVTGLCRRHGVHRPGIRHGLRSGLHRGHPHRRRSSRRRGAATRAQDRSAARRGGRAAGHPYRGRAHRDSGQGCGTVAEILVGKGVRPQGGQAPDLETRRRPGDETGGRAAAPGAVRRSGGQALGQRRGPVRRRADQAPLRPPRPWSGEDQGAPTAFSGLDPHRRRACPVRHRGGAGGQPAHRVDAPLRRVAGCGLSAL